MHAIDFINVTKKFTPVCGVDDVSFFVEKGAALCLSGPSGAGKTTLLRLIAGFERPDAGSVVLDGVECSTPERMAPAAERAIGMVFQDMALWPHLSGERHLDFVLRGRGLSRNERRERAARLLDLCALHERRRAFPNELSGGEAQRLAIARALAVEPRILLLDEPFSNLDAASRDRITAEIFRRKRDAGLTIVLVTHRVEDSAGIADRTLYMDKGRLLSEIACDPNRPH